MPSIQRIIGLLLAGLAALIAGALLLAWSGLYNIAASRGHWAVVEWFLAFGMRNSVELRARFVEVPPLDSPDLVTLGAAHFHSHCASCHGMPGTPVGPVARGMLPPPPNLSLAVPNWNDRELFWIVKHGIKYTGMPAWPAQQRDDEVWAVVAFLKRLPALDMNGYLQLALGSVAVTPQSGVEIATADATAMALSACARCHGAEGRRPASGLAPLLHGQPREFLSDALRAFAAGTRASGIMQPVAAELNSDAMQRVADYYAALAIPGAPTAGADGKPAVEMGRALAIDGLAGERIPACMSCHGPDALKTYPRLAGQNAPYMAARLRRWKNGAAPETEAGAVMAPIARLLNDQQIDAVTTYFAGQPVTAATGARRP